MREIKFRGKRLDNGEWAYGYLMNMHSPERLFIGVWKSLGGETTVKDELFCSYHEVDPKTVGQYTGLKDKNGRMIYKGDIVFAACCEKYLEVIWNDIGCGSWWFAEKIDGDMYHVGKIDLDWLEVKGNIHDNPELLEGDEEVGEH